MVRIRLSALLDAGFPTFSLKASSIGRHTLSLKVLSRAGRVKRNISIVSTYPEFSHEFSKKKKKKKIKKPYIPV
jgi:hypothetical protein